MKNDNEIFSKMLNELEGNVNRILNPTTAECANHEGCMFGDVCGRNTSQCALILEIQGKPLPPACQKLIDELLETS